ncbi:MAG: alpha/beta fold hydrolase [Ilumatobacteraceae bacterium]
MTVESLVHCRVRLALHTLRAGEGRPLLLLHGLGEESPAIVPEACGEWAGPVHALDFTGHGASTVPVGGGYSAEILMADADAALARLGACTVVGRGIGAYVALLIAGARPSLVRGAVLCDGPGLWGGASGPTSASFPVLHQPRRTPDPYALLELSRDLRPRDYAALFARLAIEHSGLDEPISVAATVRPPWLESVVSEVGVVERPLASALAAYSSLA